MGGKARAGINMDDVFRLLYETEREAGVHVHIVVRRLGNEPRPTLGRVTAIATRLSGNKALSVASVTREAPTAQAQTLEGLIISVVSELSTRLLERALKDDSAEQGRLFP